MPVYFETLNNGNFSSLWKRTLYDIITFTSTTVLYYPFHPIMFVPITVTKLRKPVIHPVPILILSHPHPFHLQITKSPNKKNCLHLKLISTNPITTISSYSPTTYADTRDTHKTPSAPHPHSSTGPCKIPLPSHHTSHTAPPPSPCSVPN